MYGRGSAKKCMYAYPNSIMECDSPHLKGREELWWQRFIGLGDRSRPSGGYLGRGEVGDARCGFVGDVGLGWLGHRERLE